MNQRRILIIEDDVGIREVTKFSLEMDGHWRVAVANCGKEGLLKARTIHPDVILLDLILPDMGETEVFEQLQSNKALRKIPIILFTAKLPHLELAKHAENNIKGIIYKPFDSLKLSERICDILKHQHLAVGSGIS